MNKKYFWILGICIMLCALIIPGSVYASSFNLDSVIGDANNFFGDAIMQTDENGGFLDNAGSLLTPIIDVIFTIGNLIILCSAAFMGLRYVWSGVQEKASIKESAINMSVGVIFFYMARGIYEVASKIITGIIIKDGNGFVTGFDSVAGNIWANVAYVVKVLALIGFIATGLKYMLTSADTRADLKKSLFPVIVGLLVIFLMTDIIGTILDISQEVLNVGDSYVDDVQNISGGKVDKTVTSVMGNVYGTITLVFQFLSVGIVVFTGLRYMFASADTRADIKKQTIILMAGAAMVFGAMEIIKTIQKIGSDIL